MSKRLLSLFLSFSALGANVEAARSPDKKPVTRKTATSRPSALREPLRLLFAHSAASGTLTPIANRAGSYRLSMAGVAPLVIYFSDRPQRIAGHLPVSAFIDLIGFGKEAAPNAVVELSEGATSEDVLVVELSNPAYDKPNNTLAFDVRPLSSPREGLAVWSARADKQIPTTFGPVTLFIDDTSGGLSYNVLRIMTGLGGKPYSN